MNVECLGLSTYQRYHNDTGTMASCGSSSQFGVQFISEFRIVLVGNRGAGKTCLANMILHRQPTAPRRTARCVKIRGVAAGRLVTVVDTPGWWKNFPISETPEVLKQELALSVTHCAPGPHAVLLVVRLDADYKDRARRAAQEHLELLGEGVWRHAMVVFTYGDGLQDQAVERRLGGEGEALLQGLVDRCGSRYHVINVDRYSAPGVTSLLEAIEEMVWRNGGLPYEAAPEPLRQVTEDRRAAEARATKRRMTVQERRVSREGHNCTLPSVSMVLLGYRRAGKTSVRNTIFGRGNSGCRRTSQCVKTQGEVAGKLVTVVDTPGWWKALPARDTPELDKREMFSGVALCSLGAHALLLAIRADMTFTADDRKSVEEHMELLGKRVWNHTVLLFTHADLLGDTAIEQYIESEGGDLKLLVAKCQNRYHALDNANLANTSQVTQLLQKVEETASESGGRRYEVDQRVYKEWRQKWRAVGKKVKKKMKNRGVMNSAKGGGQHLSELSLVLLGYAESGKTSTGNTILGTAAFGSGRTSQCVRRCGVVAGRRLTVVDSPGWWKRSPSERTPQDTKREIGRSVTLTAPGPVAFLLVVRLDGSFQEEERRAAEDHLGLLGGAAWERTVVLFSCGDWLGDRPVELHVESEGQALQWLQEKCGGRCCVFSNRNRHGTGTQVAELLEEVEELLGRDGALGPTGT
ncbi:GTPase IMAP family member 8 [Electrophorus electricus]|uniref:AIG1-type G domain-containing protein n=1 Tax=Electrophorus electricus TaxID=8005 RepID=A0A4W4GSD2_ELEEL|nr:GTPase IMAP family member 8 [Electrophorus electricus]